MRKLLSILLLAVFGLAAVSPLFALGAQGETGLAACCRRNGRHHCAGAALMRSEQQPAFSAQAEKCPYGATAIARTHRDDLAPAGRQSVTNAPLAHGSVVPQLPSGHSATAASQRYKRGPPALVSL